MGVYTDATWESEREKIREEVKTPRVTVMVSISGPPEIGKEDSTRGLATTLESHGFTVLVRHEAPGPVPNNVIYGYRSRQHDLLDPNRW